MSHFMEHSMIAEGYKVQLSVSVFEEIQQNQAPIYENSHTRVMSCLSSRSSMCCKAWYCFSGPAVLGILESILKWAFKTTVT